MSLITCSECGGSVSDKAYVCPHCGLDVRVLQSQGKTCMKCTNYSSSLANRCTYGPDGYPCLMWKKNPYFHL